MEPQDVRALRKTLGLTQMQMAVRLKVTIATVVRWEQGQCIPSPMALAKLRRLQAQLERQQSQSA